MRAHNASALLMGVLLAPLASCSDGASTEPGSAASQPAADDVDRLRALPYLGYTKEKTGSSRGGVVASDPQRSYPGYTLYSNRNLCSAELVDQKGNLAHSWRSPPCHHWTNTELLRSGDLLFTGMDEIEADEHGPWLAAHFLMRLSWTGERIWKLRMPAHHDVELTPRNQFLTLSRRYLIVPSIHPSVEVRDSLLALVSLDGELVEEISLYETLTADRADYTLREVRVAKKHGKREIDLFHANSVEWMRHPKLVTKHPIFAAGNVLVSIRHQDAIVVIDWDRRQLVWSWGEGELSGPHDATVLDNGNILVFDNGLARRWSRVVEVDPLTERIVWEYRAPIPKEFFTASRGASQRLPNGNTLITNSDSGQIFEVTPEGEMVWEFLNPNLNEEGHRATIVRAKRYEPSLVKRLLKN